MLFALLVKSFLKGVKGRSNCYDKDDKDDNVMSIIDNAVDACCGMVVRECALCGKPVDEGVALPYIETPATPGTRTPPASQATLAIFANRGFAKVSDIAISVSNAGTLALWGAL